MNKKETTKAFALISTAYPRAEEFKCKPDELMARITLWSEYFKDVPFHNVELALTEHIRSSSFAPTIADVESNLKRLCNESMPTSIEMWEQLIDSAEKWSDLETSFGYTAITDNGRTQGAIAREKANQIYESLNPFLKRYCGTYSGFIGIVKEIGSERNQFSARNRFDRYCKEWKTDAKYQDYLSLMPHIDSNEGASYDIEEAKRKALEVPTNTKRRR